MMNDCFTIFHKDKQLKIHPSKKEIQILLGAINLVFDAKNQEICKYDSQTYERLPITKSEKESYKKTFFKYIYHTKSWEAPSLL